MRQRRQTNKRTDRQTDGQHHRVNFSGALIAISIADGVCLQISRFHISCQFFDCSLFYFQSRFSSQCYKDRTDVTVPELPGKLQAIDRIKCLEDKSVDV